MASAEDIAAGAAQQAGGLRRALGLPLLTLYGLGVTIGAGIYVLIGAVAAKAGVFTPISFLAASAAVAFTGFTYAELISRFPVSAGEAEFVAQGFRRRWLAFATGLMVAATGVVSAAAIAIGAAGYIARYVALPEWALLTLAIGLLGVIAIRGIVESVGVAALFTVIELTGLLMAIIAGVTLAPQGVQALVPQAPPFEAAVWAGIAGGTLVAFFAFVGFEDIANVAEEVKEPQKTIPRAIMLTMVITLILYISIAAVAVRAVPMEQLRTSAAPLALLFESQPALVQLAFTVIAVFATLNGVLIQIIMASRLLYGMARQGNLPRSLAQVNAVTRTPVNATLLTVALILALAHFFPIGELAKLTARVMLVVFALANSALLAIRLREIQRPEGVFRVPLAVPVCGLLCSVVLLVTGFVF